MKTDKQNVRAVLDRWIAASCARNLNEVMACYAPDVRAFDAISQLQFVGADAYRKHWEYSMGFVDGEMLFELHDPDITVSGNIAFCHFLATCGCTDEKGEEQVSWIRGTVCFGKSEGQWQIVHEHYSMPFDPETMKVLEDLKPQRDE